MSELHVAACGDDDSVIVTLAASMPTACALRIPADYVEGLISSLRAAADDCATQRQRLGARYTDDHQAEAEDDRPPLGGPG